MMNKKINFILSAVLSLSFCNYLTGKAEANVDQRRAELINVLDEELREVDASTPESNTAFAKLPDGI